jgi:small subunit ribosomal protein S16
MLVIRLQRTGRSNLATYRIVLAEKKSAAKGKFQEILGHYLPTQKTPVLKVDADRAAHWIKLGAVPSDTVARLLKKDGVKGMDDFITPYAKRRSKKAPAEVPAAPVQSAPAAEAPAAESAPAAEATPVEAPAAEAAPAETAGDNA